MNGRSGRAAKTRRLTAPDVVIAAVAVALLGYVASTTLRPVLHNAAATNAAFHGDLAAAERHLLAAAAQAKRFGARGSLATALERLADLRWQAGRWLESEEPLEQLLALREQRLGSRHPMVAEVLERLGLVAQHRGERELAESHLRRSLEIRESAVGPRHPATARSLLRLGSLYRVDRETGRADLYLSRALALLESRTGPSPALTNLLPGLASAAGDRASRGVLPEVLYELSTVRAQQGRLGDATALAERALDAIRIRGASSSLEAATLSQLGGLHQAAGETNQAMALHREARRILARHGLEGSLLEAALLNNEAISQMASGRGELARAHLEKAQEIVARRSSEAHRLATVVSANEVFLLSAR